MAALPGTNLKLSEIKTAISNATYGVYDCCRNTGLNEYSFYSPGRPYANDTTDEIENKIPSAPVKMGDFRYYDHLSVAATSGGNRTLELHQGTHDGPTDTIALEVQCEFRELNYKRLNTSINYIAVQLYTDSGYTSPFGSVTVTAITTEVMSPSPPVNHSCQETNIIKSGVNNWQSKTITNPWSYTTLYAEVWLTNAANDDDYGHTPDYQIVVTLNKNYKPRVDRGTVIQAGGDNGGYNWSDISFGFTAGDMADQDVNFDFTVQPTLYVPTGNPTYNPAWYPIIGDFDFSYTYSAVNRIITAGATNAGPLGEMQITGPLYNTGDGTDKLLWGEIRSIHMLINTFSGLGQEMSTAPPTTSP